jgi:hypothetical protein
MRTGRCRYTQPILIKAEPGLRAAVADVAGVRGGHYPLSSVTTSGPSSR